MGRLRYLKMQGDAPPQLQGTRACQAGLWAPGLNPTPLQKPLGSGCQEPRFGGSEFTHDRGRPRPYPEGPRNPGFPGWTKRGPRSQGTPLFPNFGSLALPRYDPRVGISSFTTGGTGQS